MVEMSQYIAGGLILFGAVFSLLAAIGILRLPDLYTRMHAASKAGAVGAGAVLLAVAVVSFDGPVALRALMGIAFVVLTTPVAAHLLARAALKAGYSPANITSINELGSQSSNQP